jgi:hypothetical protein
MRIERLAFALGLFEPGQVALSQTGAFVETSVAAAVKSPYTTAAGIQYRDFFIVALRVGWPLATSPGGTLTYVAEVVPVAVSTNNARAYDRVSCSRGNFDPCYYLVPRTGTVVAAGLSPIGIRGNLRTLSRVSVSFDASAGMLAFTRPVPDPNGRRLNFTASAGAGVEISLTKKIAISIGYVWHHTSNGGTAKANPGLNSRLLRIGILRFQHSQR